MIHSKAYKFRIYPTKEQEVLLNKTFGCVRVLWNHNVELFNSFDPNGPNRPSKTSTELRHEFEWMLETSSNALQQKERDFISFKKQFFSKSRKKKVDRPIFKNKHSVQSFRLAHPKFTLGNHTIRLEKIGWVSAVIDRRPSKDCKFMSVTISKDKCGKFYASVLVQENIEPRKPKTGMSVGIDLGLKHFLTLSTGEKIENPRYLRESQAKLRKAQQNLSRKKKGSVRFKNCKLKVARIHSKVSNQRKNFHHVVSRDIINRFDFIGIEDLSVTNMVKHRRLARAISDVAWAQFIQFLSYKALWEEKTIQKVGRFFPSSKLCGGCGAVYKGLRLDEREWVCIGCGCVHDRDENASRNIEQEALRLSAQGVACA